MTPQAILSKGGNMKAVLTETPEGVSMSLYHRGRKCGAFDPPWKLIDTAIYDQPFHVVRDAVYDAMQR